MSDIFISYARENRNRIELLAKAFENLGWSVWWDRKIPPGKTFSQVIQEELAETGCVVVVWSKHSVKSNWVQEEADEGLRRGILIPILIDDIIPPIGYRRIQALNLIEWDPAEESQDFQFLTENIAQILEKPPSAHEAEKLPKSAAENDKRSSDGFAAVDEPPKISLGELQPLLENHYRWIESDFREGQQADLVNADLSGLDLTGANLTRVDLSGSNLSRTNLQTANLTKANLTGANLKSCDLSKANLKNAILTDTYFKDAHLVDVSGLNDASLSGADFEGARGLIGTYFARSDLTRAKLPIDISNSNSLNFIEETSKTARKIFYALLIICAFSWVIITLTTDLALFTNTSSMNLFILGDKVLTQPLYIFVPLVLISIYMFFHFYAQRIWESMGTQPAIFPDGTSLHKKLHPWFLNCLVRRNFRILKNRRTVMAKLEEKFAILIGWWSVPATLVGFWVRYLPRHDWVGTAFHIMFLLVSVAAALGFYRLSTNNLSGTAIKNFGFRSVWRGRKFHYGLTLGITGILTFILSFGAINGVQTDQPDFTNLKTAVPWLFLKFDYSPFADLKEEVISSRPDDYLELDPQDNLDLVKGANLQGVNLSFANMKKAFLAKADLRDANLRGSHLRKVDLREADLREADLREANLKLSELQNANFKKANLKGANLIGANLEGVDFQEANLLEAQNYTIKQLSKVKTLYKAQLDQETKEQILQQHPNLLNRPRDRLDEIE